jgi:hypothetical protein
VQPTKLQYQDGEIPVILAEVVNTETGKRTPATITAKMLKIVVDNPGDEGPLGDLAINDNGTGGDAAAAALRYTASVTPGLIPPAKLRGQIHIEMHALLADGRERKTLTAFRVGTPGAKLTGKYSDFIENGHLIVEAMVHVDKPGRYHLQGGLVGPAGEKVAWAQSATMVDKTGDVPLRLKFFGLAFVQADVPGPYTLKFVSVAETLTRPVVQGPVIEDAYVTSAYTLSVFSAEPNPDPALAENIKQAESLVDEPVSIVKPGPADPKSKPTGP